MPNVQKTRALRRPRQLLDELKRFALEFPGAHEDHPWGETVVKVRGKVFVFMGSGDGGVGFSVKLPQSGLLALSLPFASPTRYGLGKSGWVSARFGARDKPPLGLLREWIAESYRAVAPRKLVAVLDAELAAGGPGVERAAPRR